MMAAGAARKILLPFYPVLIRGQKEAVIVGAKSRQFTAVSRGRASSSEEIWQK